VALFALNLGSGGEGAERLDYDHLAVDLRAATRPHPRDPGRLLACPGGVNPEPPIPLRDHDVAGALSFVVSTGGIGARSGVDSARSR
jgi:hypothetical protein